MCGISGELRFDGRPPTSGRWAACATSSPPAVPTDRACTPRGPSPSGTAGWPSSTCRATGNQPMVDAELGLTIVFNGCIYNYRAAAVRARGRGLPVLLHQRHRGDPQGVPRVGRRRSSTTWSACSPSASSSATRVACVLARDRLGIKPLYLDRRPGMLRFASTAAGARPGGRRRHDHRPRRPAPLPDASTPSSPRRARSSRASRSCRRRRLLVIEPDGRERQVTLLGSADPRRRAGPGPQRRRVAGAGRGVAAARRRAPARGRRARRRAALRRPRLQPHRRPARRGRPARPADVLVGLRDDRRRGGQRVPGTRTSSRDAYGTEHHKFTVEPTATCSTCSPRPSTR